MNCVIRSEKFQAVQTVAVNLFAKSLKLFERLRLSVRKKSSSIQKAEAIEKNSRLFELLNLAIQKDAAFRTLMLSIWKLEWLRLCTQEQKY